MSNPTKDYPLPEGRKWCQVALEKIQPSLNPNLPPAILTAIIAQRSDGIWFRVEGQLLLDKIRLLPGPKDGAMTALHLVQDLMTKLETYRNCQCAVNKPCKEHGGGAPS